MSTISHWGSLICPRSKDIGFIRIGFTNWNLWSFSQGDLLQDCSEQRCCTAFHVSLVHLLSLIFGPRKLESVPFLEHLQKFHLDLCSPSYCRSPQVSCLWMISGRGWNPNLRDLISQNIANMRLIFGSNVHPYFLFGPCNFLIFRLLQSRNIVTLPKRSSFSI